MDILLLFSVIRVETSRTTGLYRESDFHGVLLAYTALELLEVPEIPCKKFKAGRWLDQQPVLSSSQKRQHESPTVVDIY